MGIRRSENHPQIYIMIVVDYNKKLHKQIVLFCVNALKQGKVLAYPTDTSYGLAVDATNIIAIKKLYKTKGRNFNKPSSVVVPSVAYAKKIVIWNNASVKLAKKFWPGALTLVLPVGKGLDPSLQRLLSESKFLGLRMPNHKIALGLAKRLGRPITATSANFAGKPDCYSAAEIISQYRNKKNKPDILINAGKLITRKPSTIVKINKDGIEILRPGPIKPKQITAILK